MEYTIPVVNAEDPKMSTIEKRGDVVTFTYADIEEQERLLGKALKEITAKRDLEAAKLLNIESYHPFVKNLSEEELFTAHMYQESKAITIVAQPKIDQIQKQLDEYAAEKAVIRQQLPVLAEVADESKPVEVSAKVLKDFGDVKAGDIVDISSWTPEQVEARIAEGLVERV